VTNAADDGAHAAVETADGAKTWVDPEFEARLLDDATAVVEQSGMDNYDDTRFIVLEQTPREHNLVVCTLCSCYPPPLLGLPPDWYKNRPYRSRAVREPRAVLAGFGTDLPEDVRIRVHDSTAGPR
jgi:nitrile hydratase